jgi:carbamoylphosphate synthase large subunit
VAVLSVGQAGEFDYSGSQVHQSLEGRGIEPNPYQPQHRHRSEHLNPTNHIDVPRPRILSSNPAPLSVMDIIHKEKPDGLIIVSNGWSDCFETLVWNSRKLNDSEPLG